MTIPITIIGASHYSTHNKVLIDIKHNGRYVAYYNISLQNAKDLVNQLQKAIVKLEEAEEIQQSYFKNEGKENEDASD